MITLRMFTISDQQGDDTSNLFRTNTPRSSKSDESYVQSKLFSYKNKITLAFLGSINLYNRGDSKVL